MEDSRVAAAVRRHFMSLGLSQPLLIMGEASPPKNKDKKGVSVELRCQGRGGTVVSLSPVPKIHYMRVYRRVTGVFFMNFRVSSLKTISAGRIQKEASQWSAMA